MWQIWIKTITHTNATHLHTMHDITRNKFSSICRTITSASLAVNVVNSKWSKQLVSLLSRCFGIGVSEETEKFFEELREYIFEWDEISWINKQEKRFLSTLKGEFTIIGKDAEIISFENNQPINYIFDYRHKNID